MSVDIVARRLVNQQIAAPRFSSVLELVRWMGAIQAQDYRGGLWAAGLRLAGGGGAGAVEAAIGARQIVRTWPMRGTLHLVPAEDVRWMLDVLGSRALVGAAGRNRALGLDGSVLSRAARLLVGALEGGRALSRPEAYATLERGGVAPAGQRGLHVLFHLSHLGLICQGPRRERQPTFVLLEEWVRRPKSPPREEALATIATRYFSSHGPATLADFGWWSGLRMKDARLAIDAAGARLTRETWNGRTWWSGPRSPVRRGGRHEAALLPPWDEYIVAYKDRQAATGHLSERAEQRLRTVGSSLLLIDGRVRGAWRVMARKRSPRFAAEYWTTVTRAEKDSVREAALRYGRFFGLELEV